MTQIMDATQSVSMENTKEFNGLHPAIAGLDLTPVKYKLIRESGWTSDQADRADRRYRVFLQLVLLWPDEVHVPTHEIDEMWHAHILDTYKYMEDCKNIFGYYLHHFPYLGLRGSEDARQADEKFALTRRRFMETAGIDLLDAADCGGGGCGGGSCGGGSCGGGGGDGGGCGDGGGGGCPSDTPASCSTPAPDGGGTTTPDRKKEEKPKPSGWRRILPGLGLSAWQASTDPACLDLKSQMRPGIADLQALIAGHIDERPDGRLH